MIVVVCREYITIDNSGVVMSCQSMTISVQLPSITGIESLLQQLDIGTQLSLSCLPLVVHPGHHVFFFKGLEQFRPNHYPETPVTRWRLLRAPLGASRAQCNGSIRGITCHTGANAAFWLRAALVENDFAQLRLGSGFFGAVTNMPKHRPTP